MILNSESEINNVLDPLLNLSVVFAAEVLLVAPPLATLVTLIRTAEAQL